MKLAVIFVALTFGIAFAADPAVVVPSAAPFEGAIDGISDFTIMAHVPGYGLHVSARFLGSFDLEQVVSQLEGVVSGLSGLVQGLDGGDVVSVAWRGASFGMGDDVFVVARMIPGDPSSLEVFVNGVPR